MMNPGKHSEATRGRAAQARLAGDARISRPLRGFPHARAPEAEAVEHDRANAADPEWDGEPEEPEEAAPRRPFPPPSDPAPLSFSSDRGADDGYRKLAKLEIELADGKARSIGHQVVTTYWHADGTPLSAQQFVTLLFGKLPALVESEAALRTLWSNTETRAKLLDDLAEVGFGAVQLAEMQKIIDAAQSDLFDVLAYIAHATPRLTRAERAERAKARFKSQFTAKQRTFLDFVLSHYVNEGGQELEPDKLKSLLLLKYHNSIADALADLGDPEELRAVFLGFQKYLYQD